MTITMFDSIDISTLPEGDYAYAGYVDGRWATYPKLKIKFPMRTCCRSRCSRMTTRTALMLNWGMRPPRRLPRG